MAVKLTVSRKVVVEGFEMKRLFTQCLFAVAILAACQGRAQGTVNFANIGNGVNAPVAGPNGLLGEGWSAQLSFSEGEKIGEPAPFLANGLFSGGVREIPDFAQGQQVDLVVKIVDPGGSIPIQSNVVSVALGGGVLPPAPLLGLQPLSIGIPFIVTPLVSCATWEENTATPCWWEDPPWLLETHPDSLPFLPGEPAEPPPLPPKVISFKMVGGNRMELRWPMAHTLLRSRILEGERRTVVTGVFDGEGMVVKRIGTTAPQFFFWLE